MPPLPPPKELPYREGEPAPDGYVEDTKIRKGLVIAGASTFGALYLLSVAVATSAQDDLSDDEELAPLFIPVAGPFVTMATADPVALGTVALILDGVGQSTGVALFIAGLAARKRVWLRSDVANVTVAPLATRSGGGLSVVGEM
jgi:hypothetical protein